MGLQICVFEIFRIWLDVYFIKFKSLYKNKKREIYGTTTVYPLCSFRRTYFKNLNTLWNIYKTYGTRVTVDVLMRSVESINKFTYINRYITSVIFISLLSYIFLTSLIDCRLLTSLSLHTLWLLVIDPITSP